MTKRLRGYVFVFLIFLAGVLFWRMPLAVRAEGPVDGGDKSNGFIFNESHYDPANPTVRPELPSEETVYTAGGGQIIWTPETDEAGTVVSGRLTLRNAVIQNNFTGETYENYGSGIWMCVPFELVLEGDNRITSTGCGIFLTDSSHSGTRNLTVRGTGSLTIDSRMEGILTDGAVTLDAANLTVTYGFASGIVTEYGDIVIQNGSRITLKDSAGITVSSTAVGTKNTGDVVIRNSHVIVVVNGTGTAFSAMGNVRFESSQVKAIGYGDTGGVITFGIGKEFTVNGGSLYVKNNNPDGYDIVPDPNSVKWENSAVIYCGGRYNYLIQAGDNIQYANCVYDEASDQVTSVGNGNAYGNVVWNEYVRFPLGANQRLYIGTVGSTLTIPEGTTAVIPDGATLRNSYGGTGQAGVLTNYGTLNVSAGGTLYNSDRANSSSGAVTRNFGEINLAPGSRFFNTSLLENKGTINTDGTLCCIRVDYDGDSYNGTIQNEGTVNGLVNMWEADQVRYLAEGNAVLRSGETLNLGTGTANGGQWNTVLEIPAGGKLTIEEGAVVDAKTEVTNENLLTYLKVGDTLVVNGFLLLPEDLSAEERDRLAGNIEGTGTVQTGDAANYIITFDLGDGTAEKRLLQEGSTLTLPPDPVKEGYLFDGWYVIKDGKETPADQMMTVDGPVTVYARWKSAGTGETPGEGDKPGEGQKPGEGDKPGGNQKPGEGDKPGGDNNSGGTGKPGGGSSSGGTDKPGGSNTAGTSSGPKGDQTNGPSDASSGNNGPGSDHSRNEGNLYVNGQKTAGAVRTGDTADWGSAVLGLICSLAVIGGILCRDSRGRRL